MREREFKNKKLRIEFHRSYLLMALGFVLTGYYLNLIVFTSLILVHEMGHYLVARLQNISVKKIIIYPYGGFTKLDALVNLDIYRELLVASSGVVMQFLFYLFISFLHGRLLIRDYTMNLYTLYNSQMIFFNLLPIYPLDGGRIVNLLLSRYFPFRLSNLFSIGISLVFIMLLVGLNIYRCNYSNVMIMGLLLTYLWKFYQKRNFLYQRFLLERYLYLIYYPLIQVVDDEKEMYKNRTHLFRIGNLYVKEKSFLAKLFSSYLGD